MSYQVLARKWRPKTFSELVGQIHVVDAISNALDNDKLHHAYLFTGTRGVGKTTIARIFAKSLNCETGQGANPCGKCDTCQDINQGRYVDLLEIDAASRTKVEDTRELLDNVQYKPTRGRYKVYLIDEVHMLSKHSFNALLKTLEEPPPHVKFLLATTDPQKLPVTILSRCLQFNLKALSREQIQNQLSHILNEESVVYEDAALAQLARAANGSMRDALSLTDQAIAQGNDQVKMQTVVSMLGLLDRNQILKLVKAIAEKDADKSMQVFEDICQDAPDFSQVLSQVLATLHQICLTQIVPDFCKLETTSAKAIYVLSQALSGEQVQLLYQIALNGKRDLPHAPDPRTGVQMTLLRMLAFVPAQKIPLNVDDFTPSKAQTSDVLHQGEHQETAPIQEESQQQISDNDVNASLSQMNKENIEHDASSLMPVEEVPSHEGGAVDTWSVQSETADEINAQLSHDEHSHGEHSHDDSSDVQAQIESPALSSSEQKDLQDTIQSMAALDDLLSVDQQEGSEEAEKKSDEIIVKKPEPEVINAPENQSDATPETATQSVQETQTITSSSTSEIFEHIVPRLPESGDKLLRASQIDKWSQLMNDLGVRAFARQLLLHSSLIKFDEELHIGLDEDSQHLMEPVNISSVEEALFEKYNRSIKLNISLQPVGNSPLKIQAQIDRMRQSHAESVVHENDLIQELFKAFDASVVDGSIQPK